MKIVFPDAASLGEDIDLAPFRELGTFCSRAHSSPGELLEQLAEAEAVVTNRSVLGRRELEAAPRLRLIALTATGYDKIDTEACRERGVALANVAGYSTESVAQHTFAMLLYLLEHTRYYDDGVREERYRENGIFTDLSRPWREIRGKRWGILGLGAIGRRVAGIAEAFGAEVSYASLSGVLREESWPRRDLEELLAASDILSIHAPLNEKTAGLIDRARLDRMKREAVLLNLGRGGIVDQEALLEALEEGRLAAAGLDVLTREPPESLAPFQPLIRRGKLLVTPHNGWGSLEARTRLVREVCENIRAFQRGERRNRVV